MSGPKLLSNAVPKVTGKVFGRKYIMLGRLLTQWTEIVGEDLAHKTTPVKLRSYKDHKTGKRSSTLDIAASTADATVLHYRKDLILERLNLLFGEGLITAIRFVPKSIDEKKPVKSKFKKPLSLKEKTFLSDLLEDVEDDNIREKLQKLGKAILQDKPS